MRTYVNLGSAVNLGSTGTEARFSRFSFYSRVCTLFRLRACDDASVPVNRGSACTLRTRCFLRVTGDIYWVARVDRAGCVETWEYVAGRNTIEWWRNEPL